MHPAMRICSRFLALVRDHRWGGTTLISLYISIVSGIVLALHYDHTEAFYSLTTIELIVPYGAFWRSLHYFSSQFFFLAMLAHLAAVLWKQSADMHRSSWVRLCLSVPCGLLLLFTGYVLRGDATGEAAGMIAEHICLSIPLLGSILNDLLFDLSASGVRKVYAHHVIGLVVLGGITVWPHLRRYRAAIHNHLPLVLITLILGTVLHAPIEASRFGLLFIAGPWFFLGLQELLRFLPAFVAGVLIPLAPLLALCTLPQQGRIKHLFLVFLALWLCVYGWFSWLCLQRI
ncbi:MAG: cytochrome b N-terminal domain-containing protein [Desulfobulbus sp.]